MMVTRLAWMAHRLVSSNRPTRYASDASCRREAGSRARGVSQAGSRAETRTTATDLEGADGRRLESKVRLEVLRDLADQPLEGQLPDQQFRRLLVSTNLTKSHGTRSVSMRLLDASRRRSRLACCLRRQLLARSLSSRRLAGCLLRSSHSSRKLHVTLRVSGSGSGSGCVGTAGRISEWTVSHLVNDLL